jgi:hypothetical protein
MTTGPLPTFVIIGAQKSATRWLRMRLGEHPEIFTAEEELHYWNHAWRIRNHGLDWYRAQFQGWDGERIVGEATPGYMMWRHRPSEVALRMRETLPDARLIAILRNPIDRALSSVLHHVKHHRIAPDARLIDVVRQRMPPERDRLGIVAGGWYTASLAPVVFRYGDGLLVLLHDDVVKNPAVPYRRALEHVGAHPDFVPDDLSEIVFSNRGNGTDDRPRISADERAELWEFFRDDVEQLEALFDLDLSHWRPDAVVSDMSA